MTTRPFTCRHERFALKVPFVISRGTKTHADVVVAEIRDKDGRTGRGEGVPYARYGETVEATCATITTYQGPPHRSALHDLVPPGAARNAMDCALADLEAKQSGQPAARLFGAAGIGGGIGGDLDAVETAFTISLATPEKMAAAARAVPELKLLKLKLGGAGDAERLAAVRAARPDARLIADANEAWSEEMLTPLMAAAERARVDVVEQPLAAGADEVLGHIERRVQVCADESAHTRADLASLVGRYDAVNIKLDKAGGLSEALAMAQQARQLGLQIMVGSMVSTSLAVAPALILAQQARWVDLDGPLLLAEDRPHALKIRDGWIMPPARALWG